MKKFRFRYESVLKMRMDAEENIKNQLGQLNSQMLKLKDALDQNALRAKSYEHFIQTQLSEGVSGPQLKTFYTGKQYYIKQKEFIEYDIQKLEKKIIQTREALKEAVKQRKIMEKLKEKAHQEYLEAMNAAEIKVIEEIVNYNNSKLNGDSYGGETK